MKVSELVARGREVLNDGWTKRSFGIDGQVCAVGALRTVLTGHCNGRLVEDSEDDILYWAASRELSARSNDMFGFNSVIAFNDEESTTKQDMLDLFDKTVIGLGEKGL